MPTMPEDILPLVINALKSDHTQRTGQFYGKKLNTHKSL